jgi:hypothetical protein
MNDTLTTTDIYDEGMIGDSLERNEPSSLTGYQLDANPSSPTDNDTRMMITDPSSPTYDPSKDTRDDGMTWDDSVPATYSLNPPNDSGPILNTMDSYCNASSTRRKSPNMNWSPREDQAEDHPRPRRVSTTARPSNRRPSHRDNRQRETRSRDRSDEIVRCIRKERGSVPERRLVRWFPDCDVLRILQNCQNLRFSRDREGTRAWGYDPEHLIKDDIMKAIRDGCASLEDIQSRVRRRFRVVRGILRSLEKSHRVTATDNDGQPSWQECTHRS